MPKMIENPMENDALWEPLCKPKLHCNECDGGIYEDDNYYEINGDVVCENCISYYVKENYRRKC